MINIQDDSGDRKYFTIIPNYILNHSTIYDREVYIQMKRIAGEGGSCWASRKTLSEKCGIGIRRLDKSIQYLLEHGWIYQKGKKKIKTMGGDQKVIEYGISDLWKINVNFYKGSASNAHPKPKGSVSNLSKVVHINHKGGASGAHKEEPLKKNLEEDSNSLGITETEEQKELARKKIREFISKLKK